MIVLKRWETGREWETLPLETLREADLAGRFMPGVDFREADLTGASLQGANVRAASFNGANLTRIDLRKANLVEADLSFADLGNADLRGAMAEGADFSAAGLTGAQLAGLTYDRDTRWSPRFDPEAHGAVCVRGFDPAEHLRLPPAEVRLPEYAAPPQPRYPNRGHYDAIAFIAAACAISALAIALIHR
jgi:hypothetical protein